MLIPMGVYHFYPLHQKLSWSHSPQPQAAWLCHMHFPHQACGATSGWGVVSTLSSPDPQPMVPVPSSPSGALLPWRHQGLWGKKKGPQGEQRNRLNIKKSRACSAPAFWLTLHPGHPGAGAQLHEASCEALPPPQAKSPLVCLIVCHMRSQPGHGRLLHCAQLQTQARLPARVDALSPASSDAPAPAGVLC